LDWNGARDDGRLGDGGPGERAEQLKYLITDLDRLIKGTHGWNGI